MLRARRSRTRTATSTVKRPTKWPPTEVCNPDGWLDTHFTVTTAREFIATKLEEGEPVEVIELNRPKGAKGYVMKIELRPGEPKLYMKLQMGSTKVIGRSFHYSDRS